MNDAPAASGFRIQFQPMEEGGVIVTGETVLDCARRMRVRLASSCGGHGTCMSCAIQVVDGVIPEPTQADADAFSQRRLDQGWRRACLVEAAGDFTVLIPARSTAAPVRTQVDGQAAEVDLDPAVKDYVIELAPPSMEDMEGDDGRIFHALAKLDDAPLLASAGDMDIGILRMLAPALRDWKWRARISVFGGEVIAAGPPGSHALGMAVDLGTTNVSAVLVDLVSGESLASEGAENPQTRYGGDLISYAVYVRRNPEGAGILQGLAASVINELAESLCAETGTTPSDICEVVVAGNTMMHHLLLGLPVEQLAKVPFIPALGQASDVKARDVGIEIAPGGNLHAMSNVAGFVGGDHVAMLLAAARDAGDGLFLALDIGTNTEISLLKGDEIITVSCPSGPALEGGHISCGMRAAVGAIEMVRIRDGEVKLGTIEEAPPVGICGSGVLDVVAQLFLSGIVDVRGRLPADHARVSEIEGKRAFLLADEEQTGGPPIFFTQEDMRGVQLAKAAIRSGIDQLLAAAGAQEKDLETVIVAGAFGNYIDITSAQAIGMLPAIPFRRYAQVGNAAGEGARLALLSNSERDEARILGLKCRYLELADTPDFQRVYVGRINFDPALLPP
ncbi:MAG: ASKHA domain-containing protein [Alphaproteobacteria bacterium]|jgi:uncharacterized 2Fe-2S/4Fe-4S cluster protein (DUF4445 family)|nr:ASKHA domain-containing protein [Alphaproteobacteria bacterium]